MYAGAPLRRPRGACSHLLRHWFSYNLLSSNYTFQVLSCFIQEIIKLT